MKPVATVSIGLALAILAPGAIAASGAPEPLPRSFEERWCAYRTPHFNLLTDLRKRPARHTVNELNRFRQLFFALFPNASPDATMPLTILVFRRYRHFMGMTGTTRYAGVTLPSMHEYRLLAAHGHRRAPTENALHEYAHYLLRTQTGLNYPLWHEEGLATYLAAANLDSNPVQLGDLPYRQIRTIAGNPSISFKTTVEATSILGLTDTELIAFYGKAWLLTHFIRLGQAAGFPDWRKSLAHYLKSPSRNFADSFGLTPEEAGTLLVEYLDHRPLPKESVELPLGERPNGGVTPLAPSPNCLSDEDRDYELALSILPLNRPVAMAALEKLPSSARTQTTLSQALWSERERAQKLIDGALARQPDDPSANVQFARLLVRDCLFSSDSACIGNWVEAAERYRKVLREHPGRHDAAYGLGVAYLHTGRAPAAMQYLRRAYDKTPWEVRINYFLGEGYRIAGDPRAATHLRNARNWARDASWRKRAEFALHRLETRE